MTKVLIRISEENKKTLDNMKMHPRETYDDIIQRILDDLRKRSLDGVVSK